MDINAKIGVLGAGVEGLALMEYLVTKGFTDIILFDEKDTVEGVPAGVRPVLGKENFNKMYEGELAREVLFRSPGIHTARLAEARKRGIKVTSTTQYFFENCPCKIIGVTGTKGKGTTSTLIYLILKEAGMDVYLGGNIGESPLTFLDKLTANSWVILELSSFQLHDLTISPQIAVVLRVSSDHMDYHKDREEYIEAKSGIVRNQKADDICIVNKDYDSAEKFLNLTAGKKFFISRKEKVENGAYLGASGFALTEDTGAAGKIIYFVKDGQQEKIGESDKVALLGEHNLENILPAVTVGKLLNAPVTAIQKVIYSFAGLPNRLEFVREVKGVKYYNDSFSTTPETSVSASFAFKGPVILIAGGSEKFSDYDEWAVELQKNPNLKAVFLMGVTAKRMKDSLDKARKNQAADHFELRIGVESGPQKSAEAGADTPGKGSGPDEAGANLGEFPLKVYEVPTLKDALTEAVKIAIPGDNVVMSPAAASFDQFKNYKERGQKFREWVGELV